MLNLLQPLDHLISMTPWGLDYFYFTFIGKYLYYPSDIFLRHIHLTGQHPAICESVTDML